VIRERYGLIMVSFGNAKPDKRVTDPVSSSSNRIAPITCRSFVMRRARLSKMPTLNLSDLRGEPFIVRARCDRYHDVSDALDSRGITLNVMYKTDQDDRALALVAAGVGLALFPAHFEMPTVKKVAVSDLGLSRSIGLLWLRERENDLKEFIKFAESHCWAV
jgi:DNA-binding transcriptional LysR family regulator